MILIKILGPWAKDQLVEHLLGLDEESNRLRFGIHKNPESIKQYVNGIKFLEDRLYGAFDTKTNLVGFIHIAWMNKNKDAVEIGISVDNEYRKMSIGGRLFNKAVNYCKMFNIRKLYSFCLTENSAMLKFARRENMKIEYFSGEAEAHMVIEEGARPDIFFNEFVDETISTAELMAMSYLQRITR